MEAMLGISLYSYPYLKLAKMTSFLLLLCLLFNKSGEKGRAGSARKRRGGSGQRGGGTNVPNNACTYE
jgi:hypothetical protein